MGGHIILPFRRMPIKVPLAIIRRNAIQRVTHIRADVIIPVLVQRETAASMLDEEVQDAALVVAQLGQFGDYLVGDEVAAAGAGGEGEGFLEPGHFAFFSSFGVIG